MHPINVYCKQTNNQISPKLIPIAGHNMNAPRSNFNSQLMVNVACCLIMSNQYPIFANRSTANLRPLRTAFVDQESTVTQTSKRTHNSQQQHMLMQYLMLKLN